MAWIFFDTDTYPIETSSPEGDFKGRWHHESLKGAAEDYYRQIVGSTSGFIKIISGENGVKMQNNTFQLDRTYEIELPDEGQAW